MKPICCNLIRSTAAVCVLVVSGFVHAEDGVVRLSDLSSGSASDAGVVRMSDRMPAGMRSASYSPDLMPVAECATPQAMGCVTGGCTTGDCFDSCGPLTCAPCCTSGGCGCGNGCCCSNGQCCDYGSGYNKRMNTLFAKSACSGSGSKTRDFWHGHSMSFQAKNSRLADKLFGWMIPSGCCGQGCPPVGKYQITYADQPGYADPRDGQMYGAQGYGMPMTVPLAPNVYQQYNYSWGVPASRITQISNYNPQSSPEPLYHQTWHSSAQGPVAGNVHSAGQAVRRTKAFLHPGGY